LAERLVHPVTLAMARSLAAQVDHLRGDAEAARAEANQVIALGREQGFVFFIAWANLLAGWAVAKLGNTEQGIGQIREGLESWRSTGARFYVPHWLALLAEALHDGGQDDEALAVASEGFTEVLHTGQGFGESELHRLKGEVYLVRGELQAAEACLRQAIDVARRQSARWFELRAATSLARLGEAGNGRPDQLGPLRAVYGCFTEGFDTRELREASALLEQLG
jgi:predicted ATPase